MINSRRKGKVNERRFATALRSIFPEIRRNAGEQAQSGGLDLENTGCFDFEVKSGKVAVIPKGKKWLEQVISEGKKGNIKAVLVHPERDEDYVVMTFADFHRMLSLMPEKLITGKLTYGERLTMQVTEGVPIISQMPKLKNKTIKFERYKPINLKSKT